ncbi:MAG TPA: ABC transporter substrate-binding protein, partial [Oceanicaulis sp.]|nr:ABC transporter substrate-binding protein [Oceanicaulis sp.]
MDRRTFLSGATIATAAAATACSQETPGEVAAPAVNRRRTRRLRMVTTWPANFPGLGTAA